MNLAWLLHRSGGVHGARPAVALGEQVLLSYGELSHRAACLAGQLTARLGLGRGDRVALIMQNSPQYLELLFACWHAGLTVVPVNAKLHPKEFAYILSHSGAKACFVTEGLAGAVAASSAGLDGLEQVIAVESADYAGLVAGEPMEMVQTEPNEVAWLLGIQFAVQVMPGAEGSVLDVVAGQVDEVTVRLVRAMARPAATPSVAEEAAAMMPAAPSAEAVPVRRTPSSASVAQPAAYAQPPRARR